MLNKSATKQKADQIYEIVRRAIVHLDMTPGSAVSEKALCSQFNVSRTPVREAMQKLADEDLVEIIPHSGTWVSRISFKVAEEGFVIRRALEIESVRRACEHFTEADSQRLNAIIGTMKHILQEDRLTDYLDADDEFHAAIASISGFRRIWRFINLAKVHLDRMRQLSAPVPGHLAEVTEQHIAIARALERRSPDQAELAMRIHLDGSFAVMARMYEQQAGLFSETET